MHIALTGGSTGIGAAVVAKLQADGNTVTVFDLHKPTGPVDHWVEVDLSSPESIDKALASVTTPFNALINNAGLPPRDGQAELVLNVNFIGLRYFMNGMLKHLETGSAIVNTASKAGGDWLDNIDQVKALMAIADTAGLAEFINDNNIDPVRAYNLSKEAVIVLVFQMTEDLLARQLRINAVSPAAVSTEILDDFKNAFGDRVAGSIARVGRAGDATEIASVISFLISEQSHWIKGQNITIDGGLTAMVLSDELQLK